MIAPDHGPLWRRSEDIASILALYRECAEQKMKPKALVFYATMWNSTEKMARAIGDGIREAGVEVEVAALGPNDRSAIITKVLDAGLIAIGSPTMNNNLFPLAADVLTYMRGLRPKNHIGLAFGSFGWSGEAPKTLQAEMENLGFELPVPPLAVKYVPTQEDLRKCFETGKMLGEKLLAESR